MATASSKRIEEMATTALKTALLSCPILESYINNNDKTPSWDGTIFVYRNGTQKKTDWIGKVPIQVKGTEKNYVYDNATFSCSVADLRNYYNDGGCVFFLVSVNPTTGFSSIYYASLLVFDLKKILSEAGNQKTYSIRLAAFPRNNVCEISSIFLSFIENSRKQISFIGKELTSLEQLEKNGVIIESLTFNTSGIGLNMGNIGDYISSHDFYLYAKPKGVDIEIPIDKVSNAIFSRPIMGKVCVNDEEFYPSYKVISQNGQSQILIGKGINLSLDHKEHKVTLSFKAKGTLSDYILDSRCFITVVESKEITLNGAKLSFQNTDSIDLTVYKEQLRYYEDVKKMLDILGVTEELQLNNLTQTDETNIRNFVNATLYNKGIGFPGATVTPVYGAFKIANLSIWIWATKKDDGYYQLGSFFSPHHIAAFESDDVDQTHPVPASQYLLMDKNAFVHTSNMDYEKIKKDIRSMEHHPLLLDGTTHLLLNILHGYDAQGQKNDALLSLADSVCEWLAKYNGEIDSQIVRLNQLQIIKRKRKLKTQEIVELGKLSETTNAVNIRCGAYLLLDDIENAQKCFDILSPELQAEFLTFPICYFGALKYRKA